MKNVLAFLLVTALTLTMGITAFAATSSEDTSSTGSANTGTQVTSNDGIGINNLPQDVPQDLKDKIDTLRSLHQDAVAMRQELVNAREAAKELRTSLKENFQNRKNEDLGKLKELQDSYNQDMAAFKQKLVDLKNELAQAVKDKDKEKIASIKDQVNQLKQAVADRKAEYAGVRDELQQEKDLMQQIKTECEALKNELQPYSDQAAAIHDVLAGLHQTKADDLQQLKAAIKAKDYTAAGQLADSMISLQNDINSNLQKLIDIKNEVKGILQEKLGSNQDQDNGQTGNGNGQA